MQRILNEVVVQAIYDDISEKFGLPLVGLDVLIEQSNFMNECICGICGAMCEALEDLNCNYCGTMSNII